MRMSYTFGSNSQSSFVDGPSIVQHKDQPLSDSLSDFFLNQPSTAYPFFSPSPTDVPVFCDVFPNKLVRNFVCEFVCLFVCVCVCMRARVCVHACLSFLTRWCVYVCTNVCMYVHAA